MARILGFMDGSSQGSTRSWLLGAAAAALVAALGLALFAWQSNAIDVPLVGESDGGSSTLEHGCTLIGCGPPGVTVLFKGLEPAYPEASRIRTCADVHCQSTDLRTENARGVLIPLRYEDVEPVLVSVTVFDNQGRELDFVTLRESLQHTYPNGKDCDKGCLHLTLRLDASDSSLAVVRHQGRY